MPSLSLDRSWPALTKRATIHRIASSFVRASSPLREYTGNPAVQFTCLALGNQTSDPQWGQGASPGGMDGSSTNSLPQTGHRLVSPSGVRDE
jgi:hypothetical protein